MPLGEQACDGGGAEMIRHLEQGEALAARRHDEHRSHMSKTEGQRKNANKPREGLFIGRPHFHFETALICGPSHRSRFWVEGRHADRKCVWSDTLFW